MSVVVLTMRKRIYTGAAMLVAISVGLAVYSTRNSSETASQVIRLGLLSDNNTRVLQIDRDLEATRRTSRSYKATGDVAALKENREIVARATQTLTAAAGATLSEDRRRSFEGLKEGLKNFSANMDAQERLTNEMKDARTRLFIGGDQLTEKSNKLVEAIQAANDANLNTLASSTESAILLVRVANWRYLATLDPKGSATFRSNFEKATAAVSKLESSTSLSAEMRSLVGQLKSSLSSYAAGFEALSSGIAKIDNMFDNELRPLVLKLQETIATLGASIQQNYVRTQEETAQATRDSIWMQRIIGGLALLAGAAIAFLLGRGLIRPISGMTSAMTALAAGDTTVTIPARDATDEMGAMAKAVEVFKENAIERLRLEEENNLRDANAAAEKRRAMERLANEFEDAVGEIIQVVSSSVTELEASANSLTANAAHSEQLAATVAAASEEASTNVQSVAAATEELSSSVNEISRQVQKSARIASEAVEQASKTNGQITLLSQAADRIGNVVQLIANIAGQTNLLALNATIEAARAGDAGKGFAVVASEVKALAKQTADATQEIGVQIAGMQAATGQSVEAIQEIGTTIGRMSEIAAGIASAVEQQGAATQEISHNVQQAAQGTQHVSSNITDVQRSAAETGSSSAEVLSAAQLLSRDSDRLKNEVSKFLHTVRAA